MLRAFFTLVSLFCVGLFVLGVVVQLRTWRRQRAVRPWMIVLSQTAAFVSMVLFSLFTARPPGPVGWVLLLALGGCGGLVYGRFVRVTRSAAGVQMSYTLPWILTWSVLMVLTQLNAALFHRVPVVLYGFAIVNLGLNLGMNASVLRAYRRSVVVATAGLVLVAWGLGGAAARAQTPAEEAQAVVDAVLVDGPDDPVYRGLERILHGRPHAWRPFPPERRGAAVVHAQQVQRSFGVIWTPFRISVLVFDDPGEARAYLPATTVPLTRRECRRLVGERFVIELAQGQICLDGPVEAYRIAILDMLETAGNRVVYGPAATPPTAPPPPAVARERAPRADGAAKVDPPRPDEAGRRAGDDRNERARPRPQPSAAALEPSGPGATSRPEGPVDTPTAGDPDAPIAPEDAAAAVALSSLTLLGGSLLQLLPGLLGTRGPLDAAAAAPPPAEPPLDPDEAHARRMEAQGYRWSDRDGWVSDEQAREYQAQRDRDWRAHLSQDAELARIEGEIRRARDAQAAARAAQAEADRKLQVMERQRELERQQAAYAGEAQRLEWLGRAVEGVQLAADVAIGEIAQVTGPVGQALRAGYNSAKGMATVVGEALADGRGLKPDDIRRGLRYGAQNVALDMGLDAAGGRLARRPGLFDEAADAAGQATRALEPLADPKLAAKAEDMGRALYFARKGDADGVLKLYEKGGMKDLAELERLGRISEAQAKSLNAALSQGVDRAVDRGTREALDLWQKGNPGVRLKEVLVADSGSSAVRGKARSVLTDFDRTTVPVFDPGDVRQYAAHRGITPAQAHQELTQQFKSIHEKAVGDALPGGLTAQDVDYKSYGGFGSKAGQSDAYPSGFATTRQATQGRTTVYPPAGGRPHAASREACVDQWNLETARHGGPAPGELGPRIAPQEFPGIAHEQVKAIAQKADPKSVAKAVDRVAYVAQRSELRAAGYSMDESLAQLASQVKKHPQDVAGVLERAGTTPEEFARQALDEARRLERAVEGWGRASGG